MKDFKILDKMVDDWHCSDSKSTLKEYLGLTAEELAENLTPLILKAIKDKK